LVAFAEVEDQILQVLLSDLNTEMAKRALKLVRGNPASLETVVFAGKVLDWDVADGEVALKRKKRLCGPGHPLTSDPVSEKPRMRYLLDYAS
jgi:hypothetical protein